MRQTNSNESFTTFIAPVYPISANGRVLHTCIVKFILDNIQFDTVEAKAFFT